MSGTRFKAQVDLLIEEVRLLESGDRDRMIRFLAQVAVSAMGGLSAGYIRALPRVPSTPKRQRPEPLDVCPKPARPSVPPAGK